MEKALSEAKFRRLVVKRLAPAMAFAVENSMLDGCPDVACTLGWIELKLARTPKSIDTRVRVRIRPSQILWLKNWRARGGRAWTLTLLDDEVWFLHDALWSVTHLGHVDEITMAGNAILWAKNPSSRELITALLKPLTPT